MHSPRSIKGFWDWRCGWRVCVLCASNTNSTKHQSHITTHYQIIARTVRSSPNRIVHATPISVDQANKQCRVWLQPIFACLYTSHRKFKSRLTLSHCDDSAQTYQVLDAPLDHIWSHNKEPHEPTAPPSSYPPPLLIKLYIVLEVVACSAKIGPLPNAVLSYNKQNTMRE